MIDRRAAVPVNPLLNRSRGPASAAGTLSMCRVRRHIAAYRRRAQGLAILILLILIIPVPATAAWTQNGHDAARTGFEESGPVFDDVAFRITLPGSRAAIAQPLIANGSAYVLTEPMGIDGLDARALYRIDLATGRTETVLTFDEVVHSMALSGGHVVIAHDGALAMYRLDDGVRVWRWSAPEEATADSYTCREPAIRDGLVVTACLAFRSDPGATARSRSYVAVLDLATGRARWVTEVAPAYVEGDESPGGLDTSLADDAYDTVVYGQAMIGSRVFVTLHSIRNTYTSSNPGAIDMRFRSGIIAYDRDTGQVAWERHGAPASVTRVFTGVTGEQWVNEDTVRTPSAMPTGTAGVVFVKLDRELLALNPEQGGIVLWQEALGREDATAADSGSGFAHDGSTLHAASAQTIYSFLIDSPGALRRFTLAPTQSERFGTSGLALASGIIYARSFGTDDKGAFNAVHALDAETAELRWRREFRHPGDPIDGRLFEFSVADGVLVVAGMDGSVTVLGQTAASPTPRMTADTRYPRPGEAITVDLGGSGPGAFGPVTTFRADWGDGAVTGWQSDPVLTHTYTDDGPRIARFIVGNDAGQTASTLVVFRVGVPEPNFISTAFSPENQEQTFFILGLAITIAGAAFGYVRLRNRRRLLERELRAIDESYARSREHPRECEASLRDRKARATALLLGGRIDEGQFALLEKRIDAHMASARLSALDERFHFLPYGMVLALQDMLRDGRINAWERRHILAAIDQEPTITHLQKATLVGLVNKWFAEDNRGPARGGGDGDAARDAGNGPVDVHITKRPE